MQLYPPVELHQAFTLLYFLRKQAFLFLAGSLLLAGTVRAHS